MGAGRMEWAIIADYAVIVHDDGHPRDSDWQRWLQDYAALSRTLRGVLVYSLGGGPDAGQRTALVAATKSWLSAPPTAIVTSSMLMRGLVTALHWFLRPETRAVMFAPTELEAALDHLQVPPALRGSLRRQVELTVAKLRGASLSAP